MSLAIPRFYLMNSYSDKKLIRLEAEYYQQLVDFSEVFIKQLNDKSITEYSYPFYREFLNECNHMHSTVIDILYKRDIPHPKRSIAQYIINVHNQVIESGFKWSVHNDC